MGFVFTPPLKWRALFGSCDHGLIEADATTTFSFNISHAVERVACRLSTVVDEVIATANLVGVIVVVVAKSGCSRAAREPRTKMMAEFVAVFLGELVFRMLIFLFFNIEMA